MSAKSFNNIGYLIILIVLKQLVKICNKWSKGLYCLVLLYLDQLIYSKTTSNSIAKLFAKSSSNYNCFIKYTIVLFLCNRFGYGFVTIPITILQKILTIHNCNKWMNKNTTTVLHTCNFLFVIRRARFGLWKPCHDCRCCKTIVFPSFHCYNRAIYYINQE